MINISEEEYARLLRVEARYNWLRMRVIVKMQRAVTGRSREGIDIRIGCSFVDSKLPRTLPESYPIEQAQKLDTTIDSVLENKENI